MNYRKSLYGIFVISAHISGAVSPSFSTYAQCQKDIYEARWKERDLFFASQNFDAVLKEHADDPLFIAEEFAALSFAFILHKQRSFDLGVLTDILEKYRDYRKNRPAYALGPIKFIQEKLKEQGDVEYFFRPYQPIIQEAKELFADRADVIEVLELLQERG